MKPIKPVYTYYYPELRALITEITKEYPHDIYLKSLNPGLDDFHCSAIEAFIQHYKDDAPGLKDFAYAYPCSGSSEGIFHLLTEHLSLHKHTPLYVLEGEYEGYAAYGQNMGLPFQQIPYEADFSMYPKGVFFISNPSSRNGNIIPNEKILEIAEAGHEIILDLAFMGMTKPYQFIVNHPSIKAVLTSLSKPFSLYYHRIGFTFTREEMKTLAPNKRFKNILSLIIAEKALKTFSSHEFYERYTPLQKKAIDLIEQEHGFRPEASDVFLLSHLEHNKFTNPDFTEFKRASHRRFCLTPYFYEFESYSIR